ncbi:CDP-glycerol glycerophosphotransferase family protein [Acinetobacter indicus]|uniref:CDP-glycerol glycerophosphotransferase family protein n=1 Tax=Acinetobacter indicus TaxID=756892 RepID=UPI00209AF4B7|nr:CDP-glycerol glycerophosphotransferase family protein [Acinetobacter indicus]MCO8100045.1 CDP-glycerol glycerophosphotransferase family protein [Acinetobacter indicus]MCO8105612.1 CDP-glycerol glycerophosphotransferase family protein [Acinetobacter indicus]MCO8111258.1 CDP-glycerol glycerophosphotransferase family protein [Acinetobacter indicus]MDM1261409.1 CDP-glycerol glycerophosphotransferase family protein [Acinetobacter indicus]MDM1269165.1 CDP-glycerol glycerophosphotransferase family
MIDKILKKIVYFISGFIKRDPCKWIFASHTNFGDNARYLFQDSYNPNKIRKIWIASNKKELDLVQTLGYECYLKGTYKAKFHALTSKNFIYTCYVSDIGYQYSRGANCINLWHGIPLKKIEFDIKTGPLTKKFNNSFKSKINHPEIYRRHDYVLCPSEYVYGYSFKSAFQLKLDQILKFPYPRSIYLKKMVKNSVKFEFLYVPTWRDHQQDFLDNRNLNLEKINEFCVQNDCFFKIKFHPNTQIDIDISIFSHIIIVDNKEDPNQCLVNADCLITDYSSIFFDYLVFNKPIIFYVFDEDEYKSNSRAMYPAAEEITCGNKVYTLQELLIVMKELLNGQDSCESERQQTIDQFGLDFIDIDNRRLYQCLINLK